MFSPPFFCQNCHNLTVDNRDAEITQFEWEQSSFQAMGVECQTCHMPLYSGKAAVSGPDRDNLHRHYFPGIDEALIDLDNFLNQKPSSKSLKFIVDEPDDRSSFLKKINSENLFNSSVWLITIPALIFSFIRYIMFRNTHDLPVRRFPTATIVASSLIDSVSNSCKSGSSISA